MCLCWLKEYERNEAFHAVFVSRNIVLPLLSIDPYDRWGTSVNNCAICFKRLLPFKICWYGGVAVPQILQFLREFDAPAMQSCKQLLVVQVLDRTEGEGSKP